MAKRNEFSDSQVWRKASSPVPEGLIDHSGDEVCYTTMLYVYVINMHGPIKANSIRVEYIGNYFQRSHGVQFLSLLR